MMKIEELMRRMIRNIERDDEDRRVNAKDDKKHRRDSDARSEGW